MASIQKRPDGRYRARYRDESGKEHAKHFKLRKQAQAWLDEVTSSVVTGRYVDPKNAKTTVGEWADEWLKGYATRAPSTVRQAKSHVRIIKERFGSTPLKSVKPSDVKSWTAELRQTRAQSTTYAIHQRLSQLMADAVHDGLIPRSPCSRRTSPPAPRQRPYVATTDQVWALHDAMPEHLRAAILLGAFAGLRVAEVAGLRVSDVDFLRGVIHPAVQYPAQPLKTEISKTPVPIPSEMTLLLSANVQRYAGATVVTDPRGRPSSPWSIERAVRSVRVDVDGLPEGFRFHDLRHYFASLLIAAGLDIKTVQARVRHASARTTLDTYGHMFPDKDESARAAVAVAMAARADSLRTNRQVKPL